MNIQRLISFMAGSKKLIYWELKKGGPDVAEGDLGWRPWTVRVGGGGRGGRPSVAPWMV